MRTISLLFLLRFSELERDTISYKTAQLQSAAVVLTPISSVSPQNPYIFDPIYHQFLADGHFMSWRLRVALHHEWDDGVVDGFPAPPIPVT